MRTDERDSRTLLDTEPAAKMAPPRELALEEHLSILKLAQLWGVGRETVRLLVKDEPGVLPIGGDASSGAHYSVPVSVAIRIHAKLRNP